MTDKKIFVTRSSLPPLEEYTEEIKDIWDSHWLTNMGEKHVKLQQSLQKYLGVEHIDLFTNGHMALELSLQALNLQGEVISPSSWPDKRTNVTSVAKNPAIPTITPPIPMINVDLALLYSPASSA